MHYSKKISGVNYKDKIFKIPGTNNGLQTRQMQLTVNTHYKSELQDSIASSEKTGEIMNLSRYYLHGAHANLCSV